MSAEETFAAILLGEIVLKSRQTGTSSTPKTTPPPPPITPPPPKGLPPPGVSPLLLVGSYHRLIGPEPDGSGYATMGASVNGGALPYTFVFKWPDGLSQSGNGFVQRIFYPFADAQNEFASGSGSVTVTSSDGQTVTGAIQ
jgi:hypothetical protein